MAKSPVRRSRIIRSVAPSAPASESRPAIAKRALLEMQSFAEELGLSECVVSIKDGKSVLKGHTLSGQAINVIVRDSGTGFKEQTVSVCDVLTVEDRRAEAKRLRKEGLSQTAIGARLGVSQKTISNDLNS